MLTRRRFLGWLGIAAAAPAAAKLAKLLPAEPVAAPAVAEATTGMEILSRQWTTTITFNQLHSFRARSHAALAAQMARQFDEMAFKVLTENYRG